MFKFGKKKEEVKQVETPVIFFDIHTMFLCTFITIVCEGKYELMVKEGYPSLEEINLKWDELVLAYSDTIGDTVYDISVDQNKTAVMLESKIEIVFSLTKVLLEIYIDDVAAKLNEYGFEVQYYEDEETYFKQFKRVEACLKSWKIDLEIMQTKLPKSEESKSIAKDKFTDMIVVLEEHRKYHIDDEKITVIKFATMIRDLKKHNEAEERRYNQKKAVA